MRIYCVDLNRWGSLFSSVLAIMTLQLKVSLMPHIQAERILGALEWVEILMLAKNHNRSALA
jgi:hypothetical protein